MRPFLRVAVLVWLLLAGWQGAAWAVSEAAAPSLIIPPGARACGLGQTFAAIADDATAMYWNPGGLAYLPGSNLTFMHSQLIPELADDVYYEFVGYTQEITGWGVFGFNIAYLSYGKYTVTDEFGTDKGEEHAFEVTSGLSYGAMITNYIGVGLGIKGVWVRLASEGALSDDIQGEKGEGMSFAADVGILAKFNSIGLQLGAVLQNFGPDIAFIDQEQSSPLPRNLKLGIAWFPIRSEFHSLILTADINQPLISVNDVIEKVAVYGGGGEYNLGNYLSARLGYLYDKDGDIRGVAWGAGLKIPSYQISFDFAVVPKARDIGTEQKFSVNWAF